MALQRCQERPESLLIHLQAHAQIHIIDRFAFKSLQPFQDNMNTLLPSVYHNFTENFSVLPRKRKKNKGCFGSKYSQNILAKQFSAFA